jgi:ketopantoate reductase
MRKEKIPVYDFPGYGVKHLAAAACVPNFIAFRLHRISTSEQGGRSSMWYDVTAGRGRTEIDWMNGTVVAEAKKCGLSAPANEGITKIVKEVASDAEARARYAHNPSLVCKVAKSK